MASQGPDVNGGGTYPPWWSEELEKLVDEIYRRKEEAKERIGWTGGEDE